MDVHQNIATDHTTINQLHQPNKKDVLLTSFAAILFVQGALFVVPILMRRFLENRRRSRSSSSGGNGETNDPQRQQAKMTTAADTSTSENQITDGSSDNGIVMFEYFSDLSEDLKISILSYVADAPYEKNQSIPGNSSGTAASDKPSLTHTLPYVNQQFRMYAEQDCYWKPALVRQIRTEPMLWVEGLQHISNTTWVRQAYMDANNHTNNANDKDNNTDSNSNKQKDNNNTAAQFTALVERVHETLGSSTSYKRMYERIVNEYIRFTGPVFIMPSRIVLGQPYGLHFFEPRYRILIREVMEDQPDEATQGGVVQGEPLFIHANQYYSPSQPMTSAVLVQVLRCEIYDDGSADVLLLPVSHLRLDKLWVRPDSRHLYYAQCMRSVS